MLILAIYFLNSIADINLVFLIKKKIFDLCLKSKSMKKLLFELQKLITIFQKTSTMPKSSKSKFIIKKSRYKAIPQVTKSG